MRWSREHLPSSTQEEAVLKAQGSCEAHRKNLEKKRLWQIAPQAHCVFEMCTGVGAPCYSF